MKARRFLWGAAGVVLSVAAGAATFEDDIRPVNAPFERHDGSGPYRKSEELVRHARNLARLAEAGTPAAATQSVDVGDVAVIVDNGKILIPPRPANPFDLAEPSSISFLSAGADAFAVSAGTISFDTTLGAALPLGDDAAAEVSLAGITFPYLGNSYGSVFVGSDGHITLGAAEASSNTRNAGRHIGGPPRISPLFADLDPSSTGAGSVHADVRADRIVVTWSGVPEFGTTNSSTFQSVLHANGRIDFIYSTVALQFAVVGVAEGNDEGPINILDLSADLPATLQAGAIFEEFSPAIITQQMDVIALARAFYETHPDKFDFLVMYSADVVDIGGGAFAFHAGLHNDTEGLGFFRTTSPSTIFDNCSVVGLPAGCELESILNMNRIGLYWPDEAKLVDPPIRKFRFFCLKPGGAVGACGATFGGPPGSDQVSLRARRAGTLNGDFGAHGTYTLGLNSAMSIMGQEAGHRWLAFPAIRNPAAFGGALSSALLGRALAHWSFFFNVTVPPGQFEDIDGDPRASSAEGNAILDLGLGDQRCGLGKRLFQTHPNELIDGYTELDQYFAGLRSPAEVPPFWYIRAPQVIFGGSPNSASNARDDVLICGDRVDLTMNNIFAAGTVLGPSNGPRNPVIGDEQDGGPGITGADDAACTTQGRCVDVKTMAFIIVVPNAPSAQSAVIQQVDNFRRTWQTYSNGPAIGNRGARGVVGDSNYLKKFDTSLNPVNH